MAMNQWLASLYGTNGAGSAPEQTKTAEEIHVERVQEFAKTAAEAGIDLNEYNDDAKRSMFAQFCATAYGEGGETKTAAEQEQERLVQEAAQQQEAMKTAQAAFAELDQAGRILAHSLVDELGAIAKHAMEQEKEKKDNPFPPKKGEKKDDEDESEKDDKGEEKEASPIDQLAYQSIPSVLEGTNYDVADVQKKVAAAWTLGHIPAIDQSEKTAAFVGGNLDVAVAARALEMVETIGVGPVDWDTFYKNNAA